MWSKTLALAMISAEGGLSLDNILLGLILVAAGVSLCFYLISKIEAAGKHKRTAQTDAAVYVYAVSRNGEVDITECAKTLEITQTQVNDAILRLQRAKRVAIREGWG